MSGGCVGSLTDDDGPQERSFDVSITVSDGGPEATVEEAEVEDVVQVYVGDTVRFSFTNNTETRLGVHDHASDAEIVVDPGQQESIEFDVRESMIGRQEIEAWLASEGDEGEGHGAGATPIVIVEVRPRGS